MPHHPCTGCEIEETITRTDITVKDMFFFVLDEGSERRMDDAFRFSGCA